MADDPGTRPEGGNPMADASVAHPRGAVLDTREKRGIALFRERGGEVRHLEGWTWDVPSCSGEGAYVVDLREESCGCADRPPESKVCKHVVAATVVHAKSGECAGCGRKHRSRDLHPVPEDHLAFFEGDELCGGCALTHGVL